MVTYKSARTRSVVLGDLVITQAEGVTLEKPDEVLDKLVEEGFLVSDQPKEVKKLLED